METYLNNRFAFSEKVHSSLENYTDCDTLVVYCPTQTRSEEIIDKLKKLNYQGKLKPIDK